MGFLEIIFGQNPFGGLGHPTLRQQDLLGYSHRMFLEQHLASQQQQAILEALARRKDPKKDAIDVEFEILPVEPKGLLTDGTSDA